MSKENKSLLWTVLIYLILNLTNGMMILTTVYCPYISPYKLTVTLVLNSLLGNIAVLSFFGCFCLFFKSNKSKIIYLISLTAFFNFFILAACTYFNFYGMMFSLSTINVFEHGDTGGTVDFILEAIPLLFTSWDFLAFTPLILLIVLYFVKFKKTEIKKTGIRKPKLALIIVFVSIIGTLSSMASYDYRIKYEESEPNAMYGIQLCGVYNYYFYEAYEKLAKNTDKRNINDIMENIDSFNDYSIIDNQLITDNPEYTDKFKGKNLLLIQIESFNNILVGLEVYDDHQYKEVTPNINRLLGNSIYFNNFYTVVGMGNTSDAEFSVMTGIYPNGEKISVYEYFSLNYDTLAKRFNDANYNTFSIHANNSIFYNRNIVHPNMYGFKNHYGAQDILEENDLLIHGYLNDVDMLKRTVDLMDESEIPSFSFAITITNHIPYRIENGMFTNRDRLINDEDLIKENQLNYLEHAYYTDYAIGEAVNYLEEKNMLDDTVIIMYGDHCSGIHIEKEILENLDIFRNNVNPLEYSDDYQTQKMMIRRHNSNIPCLIYNNGLEGEVIDLVRSEVDLKRTISNLFGLTGDYNFGVDALSDSKTFAYNPRNLDIFLDGAIISAQSEEHYVFNDKYSYNKNFITAVTKEFKDFRIFNNYILKYSIFDEIKKEEDKEKEN